MKDSTLHTISQLFCTFSLAMLAAMFGSVLSLPWVLLSMPVISMAVLFVCKPAK